MIHCFYDLRKVFLDLMSDSFKSETVIQTTPFFPSVLVFFFYVVVEIPSSMQFKGGKICLAHGTRVRTVCDGEEITGLLYLV